MYRNVTSVVPIPDAPEPVIVQDAGITGETARGREQRGIDAALVKAAQAGDASAFGQLYERYRDPVFRYCLSRTGAKHEAEDLVADVFIRAMEALDRYEDRGLPFVAFLFRIARNAAIDKSRRTRPDMSIDELVNHPESGQNVEAEAARSIERDVLFNAMSKLKPDYREVLLLRFVEGYGAADVGRMTGRSEGAVRTLQHRAIDRLRKELDRMGELSLFERFSGADAAE
ncbi:MAG: sigma-70 family RNA polymerase sigma factor [Chloroflexi bacterium]|nr:MAG: sigma-70 family RNA polymerase sigma factor [Chloroflexota bacterium]